VASKPGGLNIKKSLQPREISPYRSRRVENFARCRVGPDVMKADASWEETGICTRRTAGVWVQASRERFTEIKLGRAISQQGLVTTCKDSLIKSKIETMRGFWSGA